MIYHVNKIKPDSGCIYIYIYIYSIINSNSAFKSISVLPERQNDLGRKNAYNQGKDRELTGTPELKQANKSHVVEVYVQHMVYALETGAEIVFLHYDNARDIESD